MKIKYSLVFLIFVCGWVKMFSDSWMPATEFYSFSKSGKFVAHIIPGTKDEPAKLSVYGIVDETRQLQWSTVLSNHISPSGVEVSNDGKYVVTFDNWGGVGYGDNVVAFYTDSGLLKKYSLEELFPEPQAAKDDEKSDSTSLFRILDGYYGDKFSHSTSSRWWREGCYWFFDEASHWLVFWVQWDAKWIAWDLRDGELIPVSKKQTNAWSAAYREMILEGNQEEDVGKTEIIFLGILGMPEDQKWAEAHLADSNFHTYFSTSTSDEETTYTYISEASKRKVADRVLSTWGKVKGTRNQEKLAYSLLGSLEMEVRFPQAPKKGEGNLIVYLERVDMAEDSEKTLLPVHYLFADLESYYPYSYEKSEKVSLTEMINFEIQGITPGEYWIRVLWDRKAPFTNEDPPFQPSPGDVYSTKDFKVKVQPGFTLENVFMECLETKK